MDLAGCADRMLTDDDLDSLAGGSQLGGQLALPRPPLNQADWSFTGDGQGSQ
jgi:hypothetical protein